MERTVLQTLNWDLNPATVFCWVKLYLKCCLPEYSKLLFATVMQLVELCLMDIGSLQFEYSVLATSAICHIVSEPAALQVSGIKYNY